MQNLHQYMQPNKSTYKKKTKTKNYGVHYMSQLTTPEHEICPGVVDTPSVTTLEKTDISPCQQLQMGVKLYFSC